MSKRKKKKHKSSRMKKFISDLGKGIDQDIADFGEMLRHDPILEVIFGSAIAIIVNDIVEGKSIQGVLVNIPTAVKFIVLGPDRLRWIYLGLMSMLSSIVYVGIMIVLSGVCLFFTVGVFNLLKNIGNKFLQKVRLPD